MPFTCYSYPGDATPDGTSRDAPQAARRDPRELPYSCYGYPATCLSYPGDAPWGTPSREAAPPALRRMPFGTCFRY